MKSLEFDSVTLGKIKIGFHAKYLEMSPNTDPRLNKSQTLLEWPAVIYKVYDDPHYVGLYVFCEPSVRLLRKVPYGNTAECWNFL